MLMHLLLFLIQKLVLELHMNNKRNENENKPSKWTIEKQKYKLNLQNVLIKLDREHIA